MRGWLSNGKLRLRNGRLAIAAAVAQGGYSGDATAITVAPTLNQIVYQRQGGVRTVPVNYTVTGSPGAPVEARIVDELGAAIGTGEWASIGATGSDGTGAGSIVVPQGGWYRMQIRVAGSQTLVSTGENKFGVGAVVGLIGQSNMTNFVSAGSPYPVGHPSAIYFSSTGSYVRIGNKSTTREPNYVPSSSNLEAGSIRGGGPVYLANMLAMELGVPVMLVDKPASGSNIDSWTNGAASNNWTAFRDKLIAAGGDMERVIWYQGESNAATATQSYMQARWSTLLSQCLALTGRTTDTLKMGMVSLGPGFYQGSVEGQFGNMRVWQRDYSVSTAGWFYATGAHASPSSADTVHIDGSAHADNGRREARSILATYGVGASGAGPRIIGATWDGSGVVFAIAHAGGTGLMDGDGGIGTALTGFTFKDSSGGDILPTASVILSATAIRFALPAQPATAAYALVNVPHGVTTGSSNTFVPGSCVFDNVAMPNMTYGCPLQPCAALAVI